MVLCFKVKIGERLILKLHRAHCKMQRRHP